MIDWPELVMADGEVDIPAQPSPYLGERTVRVYVRYPGGKAQQVTDGTGLMLGLHNWGGVAFAGAPDPQVLCERYNVVAIGVDYLQSGEGAPPASGHPYDTGYLQTIDALRGLFYVYSGLGRKGVAFDTRRIYATGGSGGGNVSLMANKLAPRTFAAIVDLSGLASLTDNVAFGSDDGRDVRAGYSRDPQSPNYLPAHAQEIRDPGKPEHVQLMKSLGNAATVVTVHGVDDASCPVADKRRVLDAMLAQGFDVQANYVAAADIDGQLIIDSGHSIGNRTQLLIKFADKYLLPGSPAVRRTIGASDFERRDRQVRYPTDQGDYLIDYTQGYPTAHFHPA